MKVYSSPNVRLQGRNSLTALFWCAPTLEEVDPRANLVGRFRFGEFLPPAFAAAAVNEAAMLFVLEPTQ